MNRDEAIEKVKKLLNVTEANGAGLGEMLTAAARAQRLIEQFEIDALCLSAKTETQVTDAPIIEKDLFLFKGPRVLTWALNLVGALGDVNGCRTWYHSGWGKLGNGKLVGCGREQDLNAISYMMQYLVNEIERLCTKAADGQRGEFGRCSKSWTNSFKLGAVSEIGMRVRLEAKKTREEARNPELAYKRAIECGDTQRVIELDQAPKYELAVIDAALAKLDDRKSKADEWAHTKYPGKWRSPARAGSRSYDAYSQGREAGARVNLDGGKRRLTGG